MEKISYYEAKAKVLREYPGHVIRASHDLPDGYLFLAIPWDFPEGEIYYGGFSKVLFSGELQEYSPVMDPEEFKEALKNRIE